MLKLITAAGTLWILLKQAIEWIIVRKQRKQRVNDKQKMLPVTQRFIAWLSRPLLLLGLAGTIPAFYFLLAGESPFWQQLGQLSYIASAFLIMLDLLWQWRKHRYSHTQRGKLKLDLAIIAGCLLCAAPNWQNWAYYEWIVRLALSAMVVLRLAMLVLQHMRPSHLVQIMGLSLLMLCLSGAGFYWLEPNIHNYSDGVWLAFTTIATVGYGDLVPTTAASKVFAVFIVLLGYAMFSLITANIAALFVEEEEEQLEQELHADIRSLSREIHALRMEMRERDQTIAELSRQMQQQNRQATSSTGSIDGFSNQS